MSDKTTPLPPDIAALLTSDDFTGRLPPLGDSARQLLALSEVDREEPRILALVAQRDPVQLGRLLSLANSAAYGTGTTIATADVAVKRLGVRETYALLLACAMVSSFPAQDSLKAQRRYLLNYSASLCLTARRLATWLRLGEAETNNLNLGALLSSTGLYAGLMASGSVADRFAAGLVAMGGHADARQAPALAGFCALSGHVARLWQAPDAVATALEDSAASPATDAGTLLWVVEGLVAAKAVNADQVSVLQQMRNHPATPAGHHVAPSVDLGVFLA